MFFLWKSIRIRWKDVTKLEYELIMLRMRNIKIFTLQLIDLKINLFTQNIRLIKKKIIGKFGRVPNTQTAIYN